MSKKPVAMELREQIRNLEDKKQRENTQNFQNVWARAFDVIDDVVTIQDKNFIILQANKAAYKLLKVEEGSLIGRHCYELFTGKLDVCENCPLVTTLGDGQSHSNVIVNNMLSKVFDVKSTLIPGNNEDEEYLVHIARDITQYKKVEKQLRESEEKFSLAFDSSPDAVYISKTEDGLYVNINAGFTSLFGYKKDDICDKNSSKINIWHDLEEKNILYRHLAENGLCQNLEAKFRKKDGSLVTALVSAREITLKNIPHIIAIIRDISEIKKIEYEVLYQKILFETMFNAIDNGITITDTNNKIIFSNKGMEKHFGYIDSELLEKDIHILYSELDSHHKSTATTSKVYSTKKSQRYVKVYKNKAGNLFPGETFGVNLYDQNQKWIGNLRIVRDVTERQKVQAERDRLSIAIEQTHDAIVITDKDANIQYVNPAFEAITGYTKDEVLGQNPRVLKSGAHDDAFYQKLWQTLSNRTSFKGRIVNKHKNGKLFTEEATISPIFDNNGEIVNFIGVKRDISRQVILEAQLQQSQKMEAVGRFTGGIAHDFNNILGVIIGYTELALKDAGSNIKIYNQLKKILDAADRSADIIRQLLSFSRKETISPKILDLNKAVVGMLKMLDRLIGEDVSLSWNPQSDAAYIKMDSGQIDQILVNLCVNAKDAITGDGKITIETATVSFDQEYCAQHIGFKVGRFIQLSISDNGCGFDKDTQDKIFEPFFTTKELGIGTGLGLATIYGIIEQNEGFINVHSILGQGTTFIVYFPLYKQEQPEVEKAILVDIKGGQGETILLLEDDVVLLDMAKQILTQLGYFTLVANKPTEAIKIAQDYAGNIDLLFTDVIMPEMTGKQAAQLIKGHCPNIKILFSSGYTADVISNNGVLDEGIQFIQKPYSLEDLGQKIRSILN